MCEWNIGNLVRAHRSQAFLHNLILNLSIRRNLDSSLGTGSSRICRLFRLLLAGQIRSDKLLQHLLFSQQLLFPNAICGNGFRHLQFHGSCLLFVQLYCKLARRAPAHVLLHKLVLAYRFRIRLASEARQREMIRQSSSFLLKIKASIAST